MGLCPSLSLPGPRKWGEDTFEKVSGVPSQSSGLANGPKREKVPSPNQAIPSSTQPPPTTHTTFPQSPELSRVLDKKTKCLLSIFVPHPSQALSDNGDPEMTPALQELPLCAKMSPRDTLEWAMSLQVGSLVDTEVATSGTLPRSGDPEPGLGGGGDPLAGEDFVRPRGGCS